MGSTDETCETQNNGLCSRCKDGYGLAKCNSKGGCENCVRCGSHCSTCYHCVCTECEDNFVVNILDPNNCINKTKAVEIPDVSRIQELMDEEKCGSKMINLNIVLLLILLFLIKK